MIPKNYTNWLQILQELQKKTLFQKQHQTRRLADKFANFFNKIADIRNNLDVFYKYEPA